MDDNIILIEEIDDEDEATPLIGIARRKDGEITWGTNLGPEQTFRILNGIAQQILENELG